VTTTTEEPGTTTTTTPGPVGCDHVYWTSNDTTARLQQAELYDPTFSTIITDATLESAIVDYQFRRGLALDSANEKIYWAEGSVIYRSNFDGSNIETVHTVTTEVVDLDYDPVTDKIYWIRSSDFQVWSVSTDGTGEASVVTASTNISSGIAVDGVNDRLFISMVGTLTTTKDGFGRDFTISTGAAGTIYGANDYYNPGTVDYYDDGSVEWLFIVDHEVNKIFKVDLVDFITSIEVVDTGLLGNIGDMVLDGPSERVWWTEPDNNRVRSCNFDGTDIQTEYNDVTPLNIALCGTQDLLATTSTSTTVTGTTATTTTVEPPESGCDHFLAWIDAGNFEIRKTDVDAIVITTIIGEPEGEVAYAADVAVDHTLEHVYYSVFPENKIQRADLDGTNTVDIITGLVSPVGLWLGAAHIYLTELSTGELSRYTKAGGSRTVLSSSLNNPTALVHDNTISKFFVADLNDIVRFNENGTGKFVTYTSAEIVSDISIDETNQHVYWTEFSAGTIRRVNYDGTGVTDILTDLPGPFGIEVDEDNTRLLWTITDPPRIMSSDYDGSNLAVFVDGQEYPLTAVVEVTASVLTEMSGIAFSYVAGSEGDVFVHNDSGDGPYFYLVDGVTGALIRTFTLVDSLAVDRTNVDYEDCFTGTGPVIGDKYLYIADVGDNSLNRDGITRAKPCIYRCLQPNSAAADAVTSDKLEITYSTGSQHNAECFFVDPDTGDGYVCSKESGQTQVFNIPKVELDQTGNASVTATLTYTLVHEYINTSGVSAGDISSDGSRVILRTAVVSGEHKAFYFERASGDTVEEALAGFPIEVPLPTAAAEPKGEAIAYDPANPYKYATTSEQTVDKIIPDVVVVGPVTRTGLPQRMALCKGAEPLVTTSTTAEPTTTSTTVEPTTSTTTTAEDTTTTSTTRDPDAILAGGREQIAVDQHQGGSVFPFIDPSDSLDQLIGDLYLYYDDDVCAIVPPLTVLWLSGFGTEPVTNPTGMVHEYDILIEDGDGVTVFDSRDADVFRIVDWGDAKKILEWVDTTTGEILRIVIYTAWAADLEVVTWPTYLEPTSAVLDPRTIQKAPIRVSGIKVAPAPDRRGEPDTLIPAGTNIVIRGGYNTDVTLAEFDSVDGGKRVEGLRLDATPGGGIGRYPGCSDERLFYTFNGEEADDMGNIRFDAAECYRVDRPILYRHPGVGEQPDPFTGSKLGEVTEEISDAINLITNDRCRKTVNITYSFMLPGNTAGDPGTGGIHETVEIKDYSTGSVSGEEFKEEIRESLKEWSYMFENVFPGLRVNFVELGNELGASVPSTPQGAVYDLPHEDNIGDIRFCMHQIDGEANVLAFAYAPGGQFGVWGNNTRDIHFDSQEKWRRDDEDKEGAFSIRYVTVHELGHIFGLGHDSNPDALEYPYVTPEMSMVTRFPFTISASIPDRRSLRNAHVDLIDQTAKDFDRVELMPHTLTINNDCGPCCECQDFFNVYEGIRRLYNKYAALAKRAEAVRDQFKLNGERWEASRECRSDTLLRASMFPFVECKVAVAVGMCNNTDKPIKDFTLVMDFSGSAGLACTLCDSVARKGNTDPAGRQSPYKLEPYKLSGEFPQFRATFDCLEPGLNAFVTFQLDFSPGSDGQVVQLDLSVEGDDPGEALPIVETTELKCSADTDEQCCQEPTTTTPDPDATTTTGTTVTATTGTGTTSTTTSTTADPDGFLAGVIDDNLTFTGKAVLVVSTSSLPHGIQVGDQVAVWDCSVGAYNMVHTVTAIQSETRILTDTDFTSNGIGGKFRID